MGMTTQHILVSGNVQGVGFRIFVQDRARVDNLRGWVRNLSDGRVEALAQGSESELSRFVEELKRGPHSLARVDQLIVNGVMVEEDFKNFTVTEDGDKAWLEQ